MAPLGSREKIRNYMTISWICIILNSAQSFPKAKTIKFERKMHFHDLELCSLNAKV